MATIDQQHGAPADEERILAFAARAVEEAGAALNVALAVIGDRLGLYRALADAPALTPGGLARRTGTCERYVREWLNAQAAGGYVEYDSVSGRYSLPPEHAAALTDPASPSHVPGLFGLALGAMLDVSRVAEAFRTGQGIGWYDHAPLVQEGYERFLQPRWEAELATRWLPALDGMVERLEQGASVADVGCGHGASTILMAQAFPNSRFVGYDYHLPSIETARERAAAVGLAERVHFEVSSASAFPGRAYDLVTMFDCLHDMGDPVGAARHVGEALAPDGAWMIVEPQAGDRVEDNATPVGRLYYGLSTLLCTPASLSQDVGVALGAQAGEARIRDVVRTGGFACLRRAAETPLHVVFEARR